MGQSPARMWACGKRCRPASPATVDCCFTAGAVTARRRYSEKLNAVVEKVLLLRLFPFSRPPANALPTRSKLETASENEASWEGVAAPREGGSSEERDRISTGSGAVTRLYGPVSIHTAIDCKPAQTNIKQRVSRNAVNPLRAKTAEPNSTIMSSMFCHNAIRTHVRSGPHRRYGKV